MLTGEPVLTEVLAGRRSVDRALADGVILSDENEREKTAIRHVLEARSMPARTAGGRSTATSFIKSIMLEVQK